MKSCDLNTFLQSAIIGAFMNLAHKTKCNCNWFGKITKLSALYSWYVVKPLGSMELVP